MLAEQNSPGAEVGHLSQFLTPEHKKAIDLLIPKERYFVFISKTYKS